MTIAIFYDTETTGLPADPPIEDIERITAEAQTAAFFYDSVNDACPYPFATCEGREYKRAFIAARQVMNYGGAA